MRKFAVALVCVILLAGTDCAAQFKKEAFTQSYNDDKSQGKDTTDVMFSFKDFFGGLGHKNTIKVGTMFAGSFIFIGSSQIYNRQYWKLPIVYAGTLGGLGTGIYFNATGQQDIAKYCFIAAGVTYWATLLDGVIAYKPNDYPMAGKATIYSILCPGLGQIYNKEYWKLPIYWGGLLASVHFATTNSMNYERWRRIYNQLEDPEQSGEVPPGITSDVAIYYRDLYRRYRDYSILAAAIVYLLQIIDANVFSYMHDFSVNEEITMDVKPAVIDAGSQYALGNTTALGNQAFGMTFGFRF